MWRGHLLFPTQRSWSVLKNQLIEIKNGFTNTAPILQQVKLATKPDDTGFKEGQVIEGFTVHQVSDIPDFQMKAIHLHHSDTGAQYLHLQRNDANNAFSINLRTTPFNSSGVPHILEHTTLCGSKMYPCKDPFFKMLNRSLATYMNATTGPDFTLYPFATQNQKDYYNLMSVYMDAVFNPQLKETDFRQEGWRLEHENVNDPNSPIIFKGVVFNEMKGALSENQRIFCEGLLNKMLPSHTYSVISGGDPLCIPDLTHEQLKDFHRQYYHPSNAKFYSYGNFPLKNHLRFINDFYLKSFGKVTKSYSEFTKVPAEKRWSSEKKEHIFGKVDSLAPNPEKQSTLTISSLCSDIKDTTETFTLQVLSELLTSGPNSSFYKSLVEPNVGSGYSLATGYEAQTRDTFFSVGLQGLNPKDFGWVEETYHKTIDKVIKEGFDEKDVEAILHNIELNTKHQSSDFGLKFLYSLCSLWNHDGDLIKALRVSDMVTKFKRDISKNPQYLQEKVEKYLKINSHKLILTMTPDNEYEQKKTKQEYDLLQSKLSSLTLQMKKKIYEDGIKLREEQDLKENVDCLPTLKTNDLKRKIESDELHHIKLAEVPVQVTLQPTNCLFYMRGVLDLSSLADNIKPFVPLFSSVATKMGTKYQNYRDLDQKIRLKTGGLSLSLVVAEKKDNTHSFEEGLLFTSYALDSNVESMFSLWAEVFNHISFKDKGRLETLMKSSAADMISNLADQGHLYAMSASAALVNPASRRSEEYSGLSFVKWLCNQVQENKYEETLYKLDDIAKNTFNKKSMRIATNFSPDSNHKIESCVGSFVDSLQGSFEKSFVIVNDNNINKHIVKLGKLFETPLPVSYASKSISTVAYTHKDYAPLRILCRILSSKYLLPEIREKGGAYGAGARLTPSGVISFSSYRDPKPSQTFDTFDRSLEWLNKREFSEQDVEEAKLGVFQTVDAPVPPGARGSRNFIYGITDDEFQNHRLHLMDVTYEDLLRVAVEYLDPNLNLSEGRVLLGPLNNDVVNKRPGENWSVEKL